MMGGNILLLLRLRPRFWWVEYALFSMLFPATLFSWVSGQTLLLHELVGVIALLFLLYSFTFTFNYITDSREDAFKPDGGIMDMPGATKTAVFICIVLLCAMLVLAPIILKMSVLVMFWVLFILSTMYSWGLRLKESYFGPLVGSMFYWAPAVLVVAHVGHLPASPVSLASNFPPILGAYVLLVFFYGIFRELEHNIYDFEPDGRAELRTFGHRVGRKNTCWAAMIARLLYQISLVLLASFLGWEAVILALILVLGDIFKLSASKHFFTIIMVVLLMTLPLNWTTVFLLSGMVGVNVKLALFINDISRVLFHRVRISRRKLIDALHTRHRAQIFSALERIRTK